jgi:hypothetical protein
MKLEGWGTDGEKRRIAYKRGYWVAGVVSGGMNGGDGITL